MRASLTGGYPRLICTVRKLNHAPSQVGTAPQPHQHPSQRDVSQHGGVVVSPRIDQDDPAQGERTAPRRRAAHYPVENDSVAKRRLAFARLRDAEAWASCSRNWGPATRSAQGATCASSSAVTDRATMRRWPMWNWWTGLKTKSNKAHFQDSRKPGEPRLFLSLAGFAGPTCRANRGPAWRLVRSASGS